MTSGSVEETGILIAIDTIIPNKRLRHIETFELERDKVTSYGRTSQDGCDW